MPDKFHHAKRSWCRKFRDAFRGAALALRRERSFHVHLVFTLLVIVAAVALNVGPVDWCILMLCITIVLGAEMMNTALEHLAKAIDQNENPHIAKALDIGSAAVLLAALGAVVVGSIVFAVRFAIWIRGG